MKKIAFATLALGMFVAAPAQALEHELVIETAAGTIAADYDGEYRIETKQIGTANLPGRRATLRCSYSVSVVVERTASINSELKASRSMISDDVITGSVPGRCSLAQARIDQTVENNRANLESALMALVDQDRDTLLAEVSTTASEARGG